MASRPAGKYVLFSLETSQEIYGDGSCFHVACGNAVANILGNLILPLLMWLQVDYLFEQPESWTCCLKFIFKCMFLLDTIDIMQTVQNKCFYSTLLGMLIYDNN